MSQLSLQDVHEIAHLARLELAPDEAERLRADLAKILGHIDQLREVDTTGVEPMTHAVPVDCPLRADEVGPSLAPDDALADAPRRSEGFFEVPKIIEVEK